VKRLTAVAVALAILAAGQASAAISSTAASSKKYRNCAALNKVYPHGVGRVGARDRTSGTPVTNFKRSNRLYRENIARDRDKDGIACEKA
jgi:Excalibur calcium-binding domain